MLLDNYLKVSREEKANVISHALALLVFVIAIPFLLMKGYYFESLATLLGFSIFSLMVVFGYFSSVRYHLAWETKDKYQWRRIDHICIYLLIGGSYAGFILRFMNTNEGYWFLALHWLIIVLGILKKVWFTGKYEIISVLSYLFLGWMVIFIFDDITKDMNPITFKFLWIGGLSYSVGVIFYIWNKLPYNHFIWHLFVFGGTLCHFLSLWYIV